VVIGHCDTVPDPAYHLDIARRGAYVQFDTIRATNAYEADQRIKFVSDLAAAVDLDRILLSHDISACVAISRRTADRGTHTCCESLCRAAEGRFHRRRYQEDHRREPEAHADGTPLTLTRGWPSRRADLDRDGPCEVATVHHDGRAGDVARSRRNEPRDDRGDNGGLTHAPERMSDARTCALTSPASKTLRAPR
jgi:hypothetical protein